jgi:hypothetical protein
MLFFISLGASSWDLFDARLLRCCLWSFLSFLSFVLLLLCWAYSYSRSWLFDADLVHELTLVIFLIIRHLSLMGCGWFSPLPLGCGDFVRGYTYVLLVFACCRFVLVSEVTY